MIAVLLCIASSTIAIAQTDSADRATQLYFEELAIEGSGWTAILGVPSRSQRERAERVAGELYNLARQAERELDQAILDLEARPGFTDTLDLQRERRRLVEQERERRIPLLIGVGASLHGHVIADAQASDMFRVAYDTLTSVAPRLHGPLAAHAKVHAGLAAVKLDRKDDAQRLLAEAEQAEGAEAIVRFAARLSLATLHSNPQRELERLSSDPAYAGSLFYRLLIADQLFALSSERSLRDALHVYATLLEGAGDVPRESAREIILARMADAISRLNDVVMPPFGAIAMAEHELRMGEVALGVRTNVESLLERGDLTELERMHALLTLARVHHRAGEQLAAAKRYIQVAREHPAKREADRAIEMGLALASDLYRSAPTTARDVLHDGLAIALTNHPRLPSINRWRFVAGRLAMNESRYDDAIGHLESIARSDALWIDGRVLRIQAFRRAGLFPQLVEATDALEPELDRAIAQATGERAQSLRRSRLQLRIDRASALTGLDEPDRAHDLLTDFENEPDADGPLIAGALQTRIEALQAMGRVAEAQREIDQFLEQADAARVASVLVPMLSAIARRVNELNSSGREQQASELAKSELAPLAAKLDTWMHSRPERFNAAMAVRVADAHRLAGEYQSALRLYDVLLVDQPSAAPLLLGRAECLFHISSASRDEAMLGEATAHYRRLVSSGDQLGETYWLAQLRTLQILDTIGRNTHQILPQIQRLRLRDADLGGEKFRADFEQLQNKYAR